MLFNKTFPDWNETITGIYADMGEVENELSSSLSVVLKRKQILSGETCLQLRPIKISTYEI